MYCLMPDKVKKFKEALKTRTLNIADLINMESAERTKILEEYAGENASDVNKLFEQKLVLKNRIMGLRNWASKLGEVGRYDPEYKKEFARKMQEYKDRQKERIFNPTEEQSFLNSLVEQKMGTELTRAEAFGVFKLSAEMASLKTKYDPETGEWESKDDKYAYGTSQVVLERYVDELKGTNVPIKEMIKSRFARLKEEYREYPLSAVTALGKDTLKLINDNSIALVASFDNSFLGRQGLKTLFSHPVIWFKAAVKSFVDITKTLGGKETVATLMADTYSRENYINGKYIQAGILQGGEEELPSSLPARIPIIGRVFKASEAAFLGSAVRMRTDSFDLLHKAQLKNEKGEVGKEQIKDLGILINAMTAKGELGRYAGSPIIKLALWAPSMLKANWDVLTAHTGGTGLKHSAFARSQSRKNLLKIVAMTALIMAMARSIDPDSVEFDPRSSDFGKLKFGNTRYDIMGGAASLITLASRLVTGEKINSTTGVITEYGPGFGEMDRFDALVSFFEGKLTPSLGALVDWAREEDFDRKKPTVGSTLFNLVTPIVIQNIFDLTDDSSVAEVIGILTDVVGVGSNTYGYERDWNINIGVTFQQLKDKIGQEEFDKWNAEFNRRYNEWLVSVLKDPDYIKLSEEMKGKVHAKERDKIKYEIFDEINFKYKKAESVPTPRFTY